MDDLSKNISSASYIQNLDFEYIETYSLQRGTAYEDRIYALKSERKQLKIAYGGRWETDDFKQQLSAIERQINARYLVDENGDFHWSARLTHTFNNDAVIVDEIKNILSIEASDIPAWMCAPIFRDGIVFYNKQGRIVSCLNICFGCSYMMADKHTNIGTDVSAYVKLHALFTQLGHDILN